MRKIKKRLAILKAKIKELESILMQNMVGQNIGFWLACRKQLLTANLESCALCFELEAHISRRAA